MASVVILTNSQGEKGVDGRKGVVGDQGMQGDRGEVGAPVSSLCTVK